MTPKKIPDVDCGYRGYCTVIIDDEYLSIDFFANVTDHLDELFVRETL